VKLGECCVYLKKVNCMHCLVVLVYLMVYVDMEVINLLNLNFVVAFHLIIL